MTEPVPPNFARIYRASLVAGASLPQDREVVEALRRASIQPAVPEVENRGFLMRAVAFAAHEGIRQFLDIGAGLPAWGSVHEVAGRFQPGVAVAYVDCDPEVVACWRAELPEDGPLAGVGRKP